MTTNDDALHLDRVVVRPGRLRLEVSLVGQATRGTTDTIAQQAIARYPTIQAHSCINEQGPVFGDVIFHTSIPHLLEHMIIEEQLAETATTSASLQTREERTLVGTTHITRSHAHAVIEVSFFDDLIAVRATRRALDALNEMLAKGAEV